MSRWTYAALFSVAVLSLVNVRAAEPPVSLNEAVTRALNASATVKSREELIGGADAGVRQSGALPNPEVQVELENFAGSGPFRNLDDSELTLGVSQRIERSGKRDGRVAVAKAERDIAAIERDKARLDVALEARRSYFDVSAATVLLDAAKTRLAAASQIEAMAVRRVNAARDPITVKLRAEIQTAEARGAYDRATLTLQSAKSKLASLWGDAGASFSVDAKALFSTPKVSMEAQQDAAPDLKASEAAARRAASRFALENANARSDV
ncbi:MAG: TolC family protein, partial [Micropepsaceae bacterium]